VNQQDIGTADSRRPPARQVALAVCGALAAMAATQAQAFQFDTNNPDLNVSWDNTVKYSAAWRLRDPSSALTTTAAAANQDDGDRNFNKGLISNRLDILSEFDVAYKNFGARLSGAAWHDSVYLESNDNPGFAGGAFPNQTSVAYDQFTSATRRIHGEGGELLDAFVFWKFNLGQSPAIVRFGKHSLQWGESLFFGANAIAGGMMPVDIVKLASVPNTQFKEAIRPVEMISGQVQLSSDVTLAGYYQFKWAANRLPAVGSYFSQTDTTPDGAEQLLLGLPTVATGGPFLQGNAPRVDDQQARNSGQGGLKLGIRSEETDYGIYLIRFHEKTPQQVANIGLMPVIGVFPGPGCVVPGSVQVGPTSCAMPGLPVSYRLVYPEGITAFGASVSHTFGDVNLALEGSIRHNQDLASSQASDTSALTGAAATNNSSNPAYAVGKTAHLNLSALWSLQPNALFKEASFVGELIWNRVLSVTKNAAALDPNATRDATALRFVFEPMYRQALPGLDVSVPIGVGYAPKGSRSMALGPGVLPADGGGDLTIGLNGTYLDAWRFSLAYTHYYGHEQTFLDANNHFTYQQSLKDRDFIAFSVRRTF
jgi:hypothetical protein